MADQRTWLDSCGPVPEGVDLSTPADVPAMRYRSAQAVNVSHRRGYAKPRPGWRRIGFDVSAIPIQALDDFGGGLFQGSSVYRRRDGTSEVIVGISGWNYAVNPTTGLVRLITPDLKRWRSDERSWWATQAGEWMVIMNGKDPTILYNGEISRFPREDELGTGCCPVFAWGRIWYANPDRLTYRATDLIWENGSADDVLRETGNKLLTGGDFQVPDSMGRITAIAAPAQMDTALGHGPVHVFCENGVFTNHAPVNRDEWLNLTHPIQTISLTGTGPVSSASLVSVNGDLFYRSRRGIESYLLARRDFNQWGNRSISREVGFWLSADPPELLDKCSGAFWNNRVLMTAKPRLSWNEGVLFSGLVVLDFDVHGTLKGMFPPAWDGLWTGPNLQQLLVVDGRLLAWGITGSGRGLFELVENQEDDVLELYPTPDRKPIRWMIAYRKMDFGQPHQLKRLTGGMIQLRDIRGELVVDANLVVDDSALETDWANWTERNPMCGPVSGNPPTPQNRQPGYRPPRFLPKPPDDCRGGRPASLGYKFQPVIRCSGHAEIRSLTLRALPAEEPNDLVCVDSDIRVETGCTIDPLEP